MQTQTTENSQAAEAPTFEKVWTLMQENAEKQEKRQAEIDRQMKETDRRMKETDRQLSKLGNRFGEMIEFMVMPNLMDKFWDLGFEFTKAYRHNILKDEKRSFITEIDITLENGEKVMLVEVKSKPTTHDIAEHLERMGKVRIYADKRNDRRKYLGAIAGMIINDDEKKFALKNGFYVIEPSGETFNITVPEGEYSAREW